MLESVCVTLVGSHKRFSSQRLGGGPADEPTGEVADGDGVGSPSWCVGSMSHSAPTYSTLVMLVMLCLPLLLSLARGDVLLRPSLATLVH